MTTISRSGRTRRPPATFGNVVSSDKAYGSDDDMFEEAEEENESEDDSYGGGGGDDEEEDDNYGGGEDDGEGEDDVAPVSDEDEDDEKEKPAKKAKLNKSRTKKGKATEPAKKDSKPKPKLPGMPKSRTDKTVLPTLAKTLPPKKIQSKSSSASTSSSKSATGFKPLLKPSFKTPLLAKKTVSEASSPTRTSSPSTSVSGGSGRKSTPLKSTSGKAPSTTSISTGLLTPDSKGKPILGEVSGKSEGQEDGEDGENGETGEDGGNEYEEGTNESVNEEKEKEKGSAQGDDGDVGDEENGRTAKPVDGLESDGEEPTTPKRKRSPPTPKASPAEKITPAMRAGMVALLSDTKFVSKVNFKPAVSGDITPAKLKRHWSEVLAPQIKKFVLDENVRPRSNSKSGIDTSHKLKMWDAVLQVLDLADWAGLEAEAGISASKLRRHCREVLKKDVIAMIKK